MRGRGGKCCFEAKNRKSEILYVNDQFYLKHPQFKKIAVDNKKIQGKKWGISCE